MKLFVTRNGIVLEERIFQGKDVGENKANWSFLVGRSQECEIMLDDRKASREHARITCNHGKWTIEKITTTGEMMINGSSQNSRELIHGDSIAIGAYVLNVSLDDTAQVEVTHNSQRQTVSENKSTTLKSKSEPKTKPGSDSSVRQSSNVKTKTDKDYTAELETLSNLKNLPSNDNAIGSESAEDKQQAQPAEFSSEEFGNGEDSGFDFVENAAVEDQSSFAPEVSGDKTEVARSFSKFILKIFGENAPYDKFVLEGDHVVIGRSPEKCGIVLNDSEVSSEHALIKKHKNTYFLEDLKSANGTILNGIRINQSELASDDEFLIGSTTFTVKIISSFLQEQKDRLMPVEENQVVEVEEIVEVPADFAEGALEGITSEDQKLSTPQSQSLFTKDALKDPVKRKKIIIGLILLLVLWVVFDDGGTKKPSKGKNKEGQKKNYLLEQDKPVVGKDKKEIKLTPEQQESVEALYQLSKTLLDDGKYRETIQELDKLHQIIPEWKQSKQIYSWAQGGIKKIEEEEKKKQEEFERRIRKQKVKELVKQAQEAVKERHVEVAETLFSEIMKLEPENYDVTYMKATLEAWKKEEEKKRLEEELKKSERARKVKLLRPGKQYYLKKEWHKAIVALEKFLSIADMDDDLVKDAHNMLTESRKNLRDIIEPLLGKARSLKEGQDLKGAYEAYLALLNLVPDNAEALKEMSEIRDALLFRTKKVYREALILESMSLFTEAKDKFQEVQQISPSDSEYYRKATKKLQDYME